MARLRRLHKRARREAIRAQRRENARARYADRPLAERVAERVRFEIQGVREQQPLDEYFPRNMSMILVRSDYRDEAGTYHYFMPASSEMATDPKIANMALERARVSFVVWLLARPRRRRYLRQALRITEK